MSKSRLFRRRVHAFSAASILFSIPASAQTAYKFDFGPGPVKAGYTQVVAATNYTSARGYGFDFNVPVTCVDRGGNDSLLRDVCYNTGYFYFSMNLVEGNYTITVTLGDQSAATVTTIKAESRRLMVEKSQTASGAFDTRTFTVNRRNTAIATAGGGGTVAINSREMGGLNWDGNKLTIEFNNSHPSVAALEIVPATAPRQIFLAGNSTQCDWATETEAAWGQMFPRFFKPTAVVVSLAEAGKTTSAFISDLRLRKITSLMNAGDHVFVEFAHNDQKSLSIATYQANLRTFIAQAHAKGGIPIFVTPTTRRTFVGNIVTANTFVQSGVGDFLAAFKQVAVDSNVKVIDLNAGSAAFVQALGPTGSASAYWNNAGTIDDTHFNDYGAYELAKIVVEGIRTGIPALVPYLADDVVAFNPAVPDSLSAWTFPLSADTSVWHYHATGIIGKANAVNVRGGSSLSIDVSALSVAYAGGEKGDAEFAVYSAGGRKVAAKTKSGLDGEGSFTWKELEKLPRGEYFLRMKINGKYRGKISFVKD